VSGQVTSLADSRPKARDVAVVLLGEVQIGDQDFGDGDLVIMSDIAAGLPRGNQAAISGEAFVATILSRQVVVLAVDGNTSSVTRLGVLSEHDS
jgi:hypothetical protein